jgi:protease-4
LGERVGFERSLAMLIRRWAACVACAVGVVVGAAPAMGQGAKRVGLITVEGTPRARPSELAWLLGSKEPTLRELVEAIGEAGENEKIDTLAIRLKDAELDRADAEEIGAAITRAREGGKRVVVFAESYGPMEFVVGSFADRAVIQSGGAAELPGMFMQELYLADTLSWLGLKADMVQIGDYKGADETMVNAGPSKAWDQNINQLLDSLYGTMREELKAGRKLDDAGLDAAMKTAWMADADEAVKSGLVDAAVDLPALGAYLATGKADAKADKDAVEWVEIPVGDEGELAVDPSNPMAAFGAMMQIFSKMPEKTPKGPAIAVLHIDGTIVDGDSKTGGLFGEASVGSRTIRNALEDIRGEDKIKGVVVRIDSPGGSAVASEIIWQGIRAVAAVKPVWVSVGGMAASGGYYCAVAGDRIYLNPSSIVGSIGVVGGKMAMGGLFEKVKVHAVSRGRGPMAGMFDPSRPWNAEELGLIRAKMTRTYELFTKRVSQGRKGIDLSTTAEGRLFAGEKAVAMKMADEVGGLDDAIDDLAEQLKLEDYEVMDFPGPKGLGEVLEDMLGGMAMGPSLAAAQSGRDQWHVASLLREVVGERDWPVVAGAVRGLMELRKEPVVLMMPRAIVIR